MSQQSGQIHQVECIRRGTNNSHHLVHIDKEFSPVKYRQYKQHYTEENGISQTEEHHQYKSSSASVLITRSEVG